MKRIRDADGTREIREDFLNQKKDPKAHVHEIVHVHVHEGMVARSHKNGAQMERAAAPTNESRRERHASKRTRHGSGRKTNTLTLLSFFSPSFFPALVPGRHASSDNVITWTPSSARLINLFSLLIHLLLPRLLALLFLCVDAAASAPAAMCLSHSRLCVCVLFFLSCSPNELGDVFPN